MKDKTDKTEKEEKTKNSLGRQTRANLAVSVLYQIVAAACSLILPRFILRAFGSEVNGLMQSINQLLSYTMLMECGVGGQILASFYKPLADKDEKAVSDVFHYSRRFFNKISYVYMALQCFWHLPPNRLSAPNTRISTFSRLYSFLLSAIIFVLFCLNAENPHPCRPKNPHCAGRAERDAHSQRHHLRGRHSSWLRHSYRQVSQRDRVLAQSAVFPLLCQQALSHP